MFTSEEILAKVNLYIDTLPYDRRPESLYAPIRYVLSLGGKRIRPVLMMLAYNLYADDVDSILPVACGLETFHNFTLLHDDLMDNAELRRGQQTVHKKWNANTAILSGDTMFVMAFERMTHCRADKLADVVGTFTETALEIDEGQQMDMDFENRTDVTEDEYIEMIRLKTSVLLACAVKIGAILADASAEDAETLYKFAEQLGLAFQLQDDFLDVYGDTKVFGKAIGGDITSNKKTYMLINACNRANGEQQAELMSWIERKDFDAQEKIAAVTRLYNDIGIDKLAQRKIEEYFAESRKYLDKLNVPEERKSELRKYVANMMNRQN